MDCGCHRPPPWERKERDSDDSASDWYSGNEAPADSIGDERILTRDGHAKKKIQKVGIGQSKPGKKDLVVFHYTAWRVEALHEEDFIAEDPLKWSRQGFKRVGQIEEEQVAVQLGKGSLPVGLEVCLREMKSKEQARLYCNGGYGRITAPMFGESGEGLTEVAPLKLFYKGKMRASKKLQFLPACPIDPGPFVFKYQSMCKPSDKLEVEIELFEFLQMSQIKSDPPVQKITLSKGRCRSRRRPSEGDAVTFDLDEINSSTVSLAEAVMNWQSTGARSISTYLSSTSLPYGPSLSCALASMHEGEQAIFILGQRSPENTTSERDLANGEIWLYCCLTSFSRRTELQANVRSGSLGCLASQVVLFKEDIRPEPVDVRVKASQGDNIVIAYKKRDDDYGILSWALGSGAAPQFWDIAVQSMFLYQCACFRIHQEILIADKPTASYDGQEPLRHASGCSAEVLAGISAHLFGDKNRQDLDVDFQHAIQTLGKGWTKSGNESNWHSLLGTLEDSADDREELHFQWLLLAVGEEPDPDSDHEKLPFVQQYRGLGNALVKERSFVEAADAYTRALGACRRHELYRDFFPHDHGAQYRGCSAASGGQSYEPVHVKANPDALEASKWLHEATIACHSNLALCSLQTHDFRSCIPHADWILAADPGNTKALFRRGVAKAKLGDLDGGLLDLKLARESDPSNSAVLKEMKQVQDMIRTGRKAEKAMFAGKLLKASGPEAAKEQPAPDVQADSCQNHASEMGSIEGISAAGRSPHHSSDDRELNLVREAIKGSDFDKSRLAFSIYDVDGDGFISREDLFSLLKSVVGQNLSDSQIRQLVDRQMRASDSDHDGKLSFDEFQAAVANLFGNDDETE